jgi:tritrans,polycis-undecaprenyl-diphosphate synthase [geranylgeranyl-diphosphate specific]
VRHVPSKISRLISDAAYERYEKSLLKEVKSSPTPHHVAIIMDGNRRFALELGLDAERGHLEGKNKLEEVLGWCLELDIKILTVYAFSTENFARSSDEVKALMALFEKSFREVGDDERVHKHKIRVRVLGQRAVIPESVMKAIEYAEERTRSYTNYSFNVCMAYGGREEILSALRAVASKVKEGALAIEDIDEHVFTKHLYTADLPDPDLVLRTSGEERISNFLLWQLAYSELYFADVYWPGMRKIDFLRAIRSYQQRKRRHGG